jgi:anti-anti-sigma factor
MKKLTQSGRAFPGMRLFKATPAQERYIKPLMSSIDMEKKSGILFARIQIEDFSMYNVPEIKNAIDMTLDEDTHSLLIDMKKVCIVDSSAFGALVRMRGKLVAKDGILGLVNLHAEIAKILHLLNLDKLFPVFTSNEAGIKAANISKKSQVNTL